MSKVEVYEVVKDGVIIPRYMGTKKNRRGEDRVVSNSEVKRAGDLVRTDELTPDLRERLASGEKKATSYLQPYSEKEAVEQEAIEDDARQQAEQIAAAEAGLFDPSSHSAKEVKEYLVEHPEDVDRVVDLEKSDKERETVLALGEDEE